MMAQLIVFAVVASSDTNQEVREKIEEREARDRTASANERHMATAR
jgi:hypothetical protein